MDTTSLLIIAVILYICGFMYFSVKKQKKDKADFEKEYGHLIGTFGYIDTRSWTFVDDTYKTPVESVNELSLPVFCKNCDWPTYLHCSISAVSANGDGTGSCNLSIEQIRAEFDVQYVSDSLVILYSKKYGDTLIKRSTLNIHPKVGEQVFLTGRIYLSDSVNGYSILWSVISC